MDMATTIAKLSHCNRLKVGCVIVTTDNRVVIGYNGTPPGADNICEDEHNQTIPSVIHAEANALLKMKGANETCEGATLFVTTAPCQSCAEQIVDAKIEHVYYHNMYRSSTGVDWLEKHGVTVEQLPPNSCH